ncbi:hypothetical protein MANI_022500 [Metarhizium anisopliae]
MQHAIIMWLAAFASATVLAVPVDTVQEAQNECCAGFSLGDDPVCPEDEDFPKDGICWGNQPKRVPRPANKPAPDEAPNNDGPAFDAAVLGQKWLQMVNTFADKQPLTPEAKQGLLDIIPSCDLDFGVNNGLGSSGAGVRCAVDSKQQRPTPSGDDHGSDTTILGQNWLQILDELPARLKQEWVDSISTCQINLMGAVPLGVPLGLASIEEVWCPVK